MNLPITPSSAAVPAFTSRFTAALPADPEPENFRRQVPGACYSRVMPTPVRAPRRIAHAPEVAGLLGLPEAFVQSPAFVEVMAGNALLPGMDPHAMCYGGHQFGNWAGQLGDGRAIVLGEVAGADGRHWALQLKGAGPTPYSRTADGLAVLRSSIREYLSSEAMHHLGIPTTRALALVATGEQVVRDMFYDGHPKAEPGAVVCRVAPTFLRFGNYQIHAARGETALLRQLVEFTIRSEFPELLDGAAADAAIDAVTIERWFAEVCRRTALMIVGWMRVGFVHGVMNTDNMSILGLTIDYGPYGWMDDFDPDWTPNTTDAAGRRYRYAHQPQVGMWNLAQLGSALVSLCDGVDGLQRALDGYRVAFEDGWQAARTARLGLAGHRPGTDEALHRSGEDLLQAIGADMTLFHRLLADVPAAVAAAGDDPAREAAMLAVLAPACYAAPGPAQRDALVAWVRAWLDRLALDGRPAAQVRAAMHAVNPKYVLRNYMAQLAIDAAEQGDDGLVHELQAVLRQPFEEQPQHQRWFARRPEWARERAGCSMLSCSS